MNSRRTRIYEGKAKILYEGPEPGTLVVHYKDDATAFNAQKKAVIEGKGVINNRISELIFTRLNEMGLPTHFIRRINMREQLIREVEIIPLEVVVRNIAAGSLSDPARAGGGHAAAALHHRVLLQERRAQRSAGFGRAHHRLQLGLGPGDRRHDVDGDPHQRLPDRAVPRHRHPAVDFKLEFGRLYEGDMVRTVLADEISPDSCRLWDIKSNEKLDKDRFRRDLGGLIEAYQEVARRLGILTEPEHAQSARGPSSSRATDAWHEGKDHHHAEERRPRSPRQGDRGRPHRAWLFRRGTSARASISSSTSPRPTRPANRRSKPCATACSPTP
jgi:phosphoribosylaminoimidazole-succinocarboxamide synthase